MKISQKTKIKIGLGIVVTFATIMVLLAIFWAGYTFCTKYKVSFRSPIQNPIIIEDRKPDVIIKYMEEKVEAITEPQIVKKVYAQEVNGNVNLDLISRFIHFRETGYGKAESGHHIGCRKKGLWNELGYAPQDGFCFENEEIGFSTVKSWLDDKIGEMGLPKALCYYNTGKRLDDCEYYQDYLSWKVK